MTPSTETITVEPNAADIEVAKIQQGTEQGRTQRASNGKMYRIVTVSLDPNKALLVARELEPTDDILGNLRTAHRLGMSTVWVSRSGRRPRFVDLRIASVVELPRLVFRFG